MKRYGDLQIGLAVLVALGLLVFGVLWFKGFQQSNRTYPLTAWFSKASGLDRGDPVEVAGVVQGQVGDIRYEQGRAKLVLEINKDAELYADTRVVIANFGMMGQKFIAIDPGHAATGKLDTRQPLEGEYEPGVGDMMTEVGQSLRATNFLVERVNKFLAAIDSSGGAESIGRTLDHVEAMSGEMSAIAKENRAKLGKAVANFEAASGELRSFLTEKGPALRTTIDNIDRTSARADTMAQHLTMAADDIHRLVARIDADSSTVGALLGERVLYERLLSAAARTDSLLLDFQRNPRKYLKFSVF
jgi:phospholipid/cholesterol/gamma-HCH transport system substrate-binding protein